MRKYLFVAFTAIAIFLVVIGFGSAQQWQNGFLRDGNGFLLINCAANCGGSTFQPGGIPTTGMTTTNITTDTGCTQISLTALSWGTGFINAAATQTQTISLYSNSSCTTLIAGSIVLNQGATFVNIIPVQSYSSGLWVQDSGSLTGTVFMFWK